EGTSGAGWTGTSAIGSGPVRSWPPVAAGRGVTGTSAAVLGANAGDVAAHWPDAPVCADPVDVGVVAGGSAALPLSPVVCTAQVAAPGVAVVDEPFAAFPRPADEPLPLAPPFAEGEAACTAGGADETCVPPPA